MWLFKRTVNEPPYVKLIKEDLERRFDEYNAMYFDNKLPKCRITIKRDKKKSVSYYSPYYAKNGRICIDKNVDWTEEDLKLTLIHEMAHCYVDKVLDKSSAFFSHGITFRKVCGMIKKKHGIDVNLHALPYTEFKSNKKPTLLKEMLIRFSYLILPF